MSGNGGPWDGNWPDHSPSPSASSGGGPWGNWTRHDDDDDGDNDGDRYGPRHSSYSSFLSESLKAEISYSITTFYLAFLCIMAIIMCIKSRTRLRAFACFITYLGLTIAVLGLLRSKALINANWFWMWNFMAEGLGVVALALTIISVGTGFYPMTRNRNLYWRMCMCVVVIYGLASLANIVYYIYDKLILRPLSAEDVLKIRHDIVNKHIYTEQELTLVRWKEFREGKLNIPDGAVAGVPSWRDLSSPEREMYARPETALYLGHQVLMLVTCMWVCLYLFVPLVMHHRHGPVGRPVDSDMMAIGVWYLTCLMSLAFVYAILNIVFIAKQELIFVEQAQALDLCIRITIGPIFFLPAPSFLLHFYRNHFQKFKGNSSTGRTGSAGRQWDSGNNHFNGSYTADSFRYCNSNGAAPMSPDGTRMEGSRLSEGSKPRGSFDIQADTSTHRFQEPTTPVGMYSRTKLFNMRNRDGSVESSRFLNRDFECESSQSRHPSEERPESFHQYYSNMDCLNNHPLRHSIVLDDIDEKEHVKITPYDPLQSNGSSSNKSAPQPPKPVLTKKHIRTTRTAEAGSSERQSTVFKPKTFDPKMAATVIAAAPGNDLLIFSATESSAFVEIAHSPIMIVIHLRLVATVSKLGSLNDSEVSVDNSHVIGTTGWEVGGFDPKKLSQPSTKSVEDDRKTSSRTDTAAATTAAFASEPLLYSETSIEQLTGLQRQLAEHRSALLPKVIAFKAYHEDLATAEPFDHTFQSSPINPYDLDVLRQSTSQARPQGNMSSLHPSSSPHGDSTPPVDLHVPGSVPTSGRPNLLGLGIELEQPKLPSHVADHWSLPPASPRHLTDMDSAYNSSNSISNVKSSNSTRPRDSKSKEGLIAVFSKALSGDKSTSHSKGSQPVFDSSGKDRHQKMADSQVDTNQNPVAATVEELAQLSVRRREGEIQRGGAMSYDYSDPYDDRAGFKRTIPTTRSLQTFVSTSTGSYGSHEIKSSSSSVISKATSSPSLGSFKSRDSLSKNGGVASSSKDQYPQQQSGRPTSPASKKSNTKLASRSGRSKSDLPAYRESIESPRTPTTDVPLTPFTTTLESSPGKRVVLPNMAPEPSSLPPVIVKTSLSPPPRQSWRRSKSFKSTSGPLSGSTAAIAAVDATAATSAATYPERLVSDPLSSIITATSSPTYQIASPTELQQSLPSSPIASPRGVSLMPHLLSPITQSQGSYHSNSFEFGHDVRTSRDTERERIVPLSPPLSGLNSRLHQHPISQRQRSVDDLASAYYSNGISHGPVPSSLSTTLSSPSSSSSPGSGVQPSSSTRQIQDPSAMTILSALYYHSSSKTPGLESPPLPSNSRSNGQVHGPYSPSSPIGGRSGGGGDGSMSLSFISSPSSPSMMNAQSFDNGAGGGTSGDASFRNSYNHAGTLNRMMVEDPWTQAMVNRAQSKVTSSPVMTEGGEEWERE
ncbi:hypothetical protein EDD11_002728 [Mortierella claussenii]|nr:hypothetical protein EDD11_002728 [Mortierella claussenii]